jgi:hypothetical protein
MGRKPTGNPPGRPKVIINWETFEGLCGLQCTSEEIASFLKIHKETLYTHVEEKYGESFSTVFKRFQENGKCSLRRSQWALSKKNASLAIWLGKQYLGQKDNIAEQVSEHTLTQFNDLMNQLLSLQSNRKMADNTISNETKS